MARPAVAHRRKPWPQEGAFLGPMDWIISLTLGYILFVLGPQCYVDAQLNPMGSWTGPINTQWVASIAGANPVFSTRSFYRAGPTCSISADGKSAYCWWGPGSAPLAGASHSVSASDPSFMIKVPTGGGLLGKLFVSLTVATDVWLLTDAGEIVIAFWASGNDKLPTQNAANRQSSLDSTGFTANAIGVINGTFSGSEGGTLNPVLSISVHPYPVGTNANLGFEGRRDFCTVHADGDTRCWSLTVTAPASSQTSWSLASIGTLKGTWYDITSKVTAATNVCGSPTTPSNTSALYTMTTALCAATGVPQTKVNFLNVPPRGYSYNADDTSAPGAGDSLQVLNAGSPLGTKGCDLSLVSITAKSGESGAAPALTRWWQVCNVDAAGADSCFGFYPADVRYNISAALPCAGKSSYSNFSSSFDVALPSPSVSSAKATTVSIPV
jgi:hypothetical protein